MPLRARRTDRGAAVRHSPRRCPVPRSESVGRPSPRAPRRDASRRPPTGDRGRPTGAGIRPGARSRRRFRWHPRNPSRSPPRSPSRRPPRWCCSIPPTTASPPPQAVDNQCTVRTGSPCCHEGGAPERRRSRSRSRNCARRGAPAPPRTRRAPARTPGRSKAIGRLGRTSETTPGQLLRRECAPDTLPKNALRALNSRGRSGNHPREAGSLFGQIGAVRTGSRTLRASPAHYSAYSSCAQSGERSAPPGPFRRPRGCRRRNPPAHWIQYSGPTHAEAMEPLPRWLEKSARTGAQPHTGSTSQLCVGGAHLSTDHNPAIRKNAP